ncbi:gp19 domain protein, partial [Vibrio harveyi]
KNSKNFN